MSEDPERDDARMAEVARREADEAAERARAEAERMEADAESMEAEARTGEAGEEAVRQLGVIYGGLIGIAVVMIQPFLAASSIDRTAKISVIGFAIAIPLLAALIMVNRQETFRRRQTTSITATIARVTAQMAAFVGIVAGFWHISWVAGVCFLASGVVAVGVHSAGWYRVERPRGLAS